MRKQPNVGRIVLDPALSVTAIAAITAALRLWVHLTSPTIASLLFLLVVLVTATSSSLVVAVFTSLVADLCLNYFFMPPFGTFTIADPQNWVALFVFLVVSLVASNLSSAAHDREREATERRDELARLFDLSRDILLTSDTDAAIRQVAQFVSRRFNLSFVAICLPPSPSDTAWRIVQAGSTAVPVDERQLARAFSGAEQTLEFDARTRTYTGHLLATFDGQRVRLVPLRVGTKPIGLLAASGRLIEPGTLDAIAGLVAIAIERVQFLDERKAAALAKQSEELKSALLASLGHDLRTPLTAIRVAASNLQASWLLEADRREQSELVLVEVERLTRLFQNILEMARIDAGAVEPELQWVHPLEVVEAARDQVAHTLRSRGVTVAVKEDHLVRIDPRLTAAALAQLLENAARYTADGSAIDVTALVTAEGLTMIVRDHGPGIDIGELPHLFERFYRGSDARQRTSGTGMGLSIARGLLAAERGRIWAQNCDDGGAQFTIVVPADTKAPEIAGAAL